MSGRTSETARNDEPENTTRLHAAEAVATLGAQQGWEARQALQDLQQRRFGEVLWPQARRRREGWQSDDVIVDVEVLKKSLGC